MREARKKSPPDKVEAEIAEIMCRECELFLATRGILVDAKQADQPNGFRRIVISVVLTGPKDEPKKWERKEQLPTLTMREVAMRETFMAARRAGLIRPKADDDMPMVRWELE